MDVKCGRGAFMKTKDDARKLAVSLVANGRANGVRTEALITAMDAPLGRAVGNALEVRECIDTLRGEGPTDLEPSLSVELAARMVRLGGLAADDVAATAMVRDALTSGRGLEVFRQLVEQQGGDPRVVDDPVGLPAAPHREMVDGRARSDSSPGWTPKRSAGRRWSSAPAATGRGRRRSGRRSDCASADRRSGPSR